MSRNRGESEEEYNQRIADALLALHQLYDEKSLEDDNSM